MDGGQRDEAQGASGIHRRAAARACDDPATAARLEGPLDAKSLVRRAGRYYLDLDREWRIGASAQRIIALAISHGSSFRALAFGH